MRGIFWLASYPKSGNTWFRAFLHNLQAGKTQPADINQLETGQIASSRIWLDDILGFDSADLLPAEIERMRPEIYRWSSEQEQVGHHKIHDAYILLPDGEPMVSRQGTAGALYIIRNPLDVAISAANHWNVDIDTAIGNMADPNFCLARQRKGLSSQLEQRLYDWSGHVRSWTETAGLNCLVLRYEDMHAQALTSFSRAAAFLAIEHSTADIERAIRFSAFDELARQESERGFRERPQHTARFFRQGQPDAWKNQLNGGQIARIIADHGAIMRKYGYLDAQNNPHTTTGEQHDE